MPDKLVGEPAQLAVDKPHSLILADQRLAKRTGDSGVCHLVRDGDGRRHLPAMGLANGVRAQIFDMNLLLVIGLLLRGAVGAALPADSAIPRVGEPVDIAPSAYQYRADRKPDANPPESWLALMHYAGVPLNQPVDVKLPAIRRCLTGLLWEEIRPIQTLELTWPSSARRRPAPDKLTVNALLNQGSSSSWWNNLASVALDSKPTVTDGGLTYSYPIGVGTCGLVLAVDGDASAYDVPRVRVLVPDTWKRMDVEIEWGFDKTTADKDYSGHIEAYDGRLSDIRPFGAGTATHDRAWTSRGGSATRRGIEMSLLYMGTSKWRKQQQYTTQAEDVARTIVTVWTKAGAFSFLAADLENGPILAPEYGFFVRRTSPLHPSRPGGKSLRIAAMPMAGKMDSVAGDARLKAWGSDQTPWFGSNPSDQPILVQGIAFPAKCVAMHPGQYADVAAEWRSPVRAKVKLSASLTHAQTGGNGIEWWVVHKTRGDQEILAEGGTDGTGAHPIPADEAGRTRLDSIDVEPGDILSLVVGPKGDHRSDTTIVDWTISELGGAGRTWDLTKDVADTIHEGNPHRDGFGNPDVWRFCSELPMARPGPPSEPPISLASDAASGKAFEKELAVRGLKTIRERTREHTEMTWQAAVTATRGTDLPPHPAPPPGSEPAMEVHVPSERLTAQWRLGAWHLTRHCATNPATGKLWFNDYPYGILAAETYLILSVLDEIGMHSAAAAGFDQWLSLPLERNHPVGLFSDGRGALTFAVGPDGLGGQMDGIHAFGPGSIGWALTQHYWMSGDAAWLRAAEPRLIANAEWMLRQRQVVAGMVPGGARLWCKGLQPALQVTPDSGGLWMQFYECEAYYWASVSRLAATIAVVDPAAGAKLAAEAEAYRKDLRAAVERSIALSPVVPVRDGTYHSVIPFACYVRGLSTGAWGWQRDGSGSHVGPLYWDTVQTAAALVSPAGLLAPNDVRVQGYLDVLEDRLLLENRNVGSRNWFFAGWQYQGGLERTANMHLAADDIPVFLRSFLNCYAVDILPKDGYVFNEHAVHGPPDKIFEEAAFLERFRNMLVMEEGDDLWLARGTPRAWLDQGEQISVEHAPSRFGTVGYEIRSDVAHDRIFATVSMPSRNPPKEVWLRLRHPKAAHIKAVLVDGRPWKAFDAKREIVTLRGLEGVVKVEVRY